MMQLFTVGAALSTMIRMWVRNIFPFTLLAAVIHLPWLLYVLWVTSSHAHIGHIQYIDKTARVATMLLGMILNGAVAYTVVSHLHDKPVTLGNTLRVGLAKSITALGITLAVSILVLLGTVALIVPGVILMIGLYVAIPAAITEQVGVGAALGRSMALTKGNRGGIFGMLILLGLGLAIVNAILTLPFATSEAELTTLYETSAFDLFMAKVRAELLRESLAHIIIAPASAILASVTYVLLRNEKEGALMTELSQVFE